MRKVFILFILGLTVTPLTAAPRPVVLDPAYEHDRWGTVPIDLSFSYAAYTGSFDSADDNNGDGEPDTWGIPEWVAYEIKAVSEEHNLNSRPRWMTDELFFSMGVAPNDSSYAVSGTRDLKEVKTDYRFVRGHLCPKDTAERISEDAAYNTHILINAVPQLQWQNNGIWKSLEGDCNNWADAYGRIWIITGPVFFNRTPSLWLGQDNEVRVAVPDALFKIVVREDPVDTVKTLAFLMPNILPKAQEDRNDYLTAIDRIEALTGLDFLTSLPEDLQETIESAAGDTTRWQSE